MKYFLSLILFCLSFTCWAYENREIDLPSGTILNITHFEGAGKTLFIWLPSERGFGQGYVPVALDLAAMDIDVWVTHLHESYIIPAGRNSLNEVDIEDLVLLVDTAQGQGFEEIYIISGSRGAQLALEMAYWWQHKAGISNYIKGLMLFSPHIIEGKTPIGQQAQYVDIASYSNLPVYMLQAEYSTKFARSQEIARQLQLGGSPAFIHTIRGAQGGFHMRPQEDLTQTDLEARAQLAGILVNASKLLKFSKAAPLDSGFRQAQPGIGKQQATVKEPRLHEYQGDANPPRLQLMDINGRPFDLSRVKNKVVLINFWATWCGPCVREIPSLSRLVESMKDKPFEVVAVNIGESLDTINQFLNTVPVNFDILLDRESQSVRDWNVYAYPSNFVVDKTGQIRFAYRGALEWDSSDVVDTIEQLFK